MARLRDQRRNHLTREVKLLIGLGIALSISVVEGVLLFRDQHPEQYAKDIAQSEQLDTAHVQRKDSSAKVDSAIAKLERPRKKALEAADVLHEIADTVGQSATTVRDSLNMWRTRDSLHRAEADSLRAVVRSDSLQKLFLTRDRDDWKVHSDSVVKAMDTLRGDLKKAVADQCRIVPFVPCLSRKQSLIVGAVTGAVIAADPQGTRKVLKKILTLGR